MKNHGNSFDTFRSHPRDLKPLLMKLKIQNESKSILGLFLNPLLPKKDT